MFTSSAFSSRWLSGEAYNSRQCLQTLRHFSLSFQTSVFMPDYRSSSVCRRRSCQMLKSTRGSVLLREVESTWNFTPSWHFLILWECLIVFQFRAGEPLGRAWLPGGASVDETTQFSRLLPSLFLHSLLHSSPEIWKEKEGGTAAIDQYRH